jgi:DNA-binding CsgD family transcriptional regulator
MTLTPDQKRVAQLVLDGLSFTEIVKELGVTKIAVGNWLRALRNRTDCRDRYDLFIHADRLGLTRPNDDVFLISRTQFNRLDSARGSLTLCRAVTTCNTEAELDDLLRGAPPEHRSDAVTACATMMRKLFQSTNHATPPNH